MTKRPKPLSQPLMTRRLYGGKIASLSLDGWNEEEDGSLSKTFEFKDYVTAVGFATKVADLAQIENHHPTTSFSASEVKVSLITHSENSVTEKDIDLAGKIESASKSAPGFVSSNNMKLEAVNAALQKRL